MHEIPNIHPVQKSVEKSEQAQVLIEQWARENNHTSLLRHIEAPDKTDKNIGI